MAGHRKAIGVGEGTRGVGGGGMGAAGRAKNYKLINVENWDW